MNLLSHSSTGSVSPWHPTAKKQSARGYFLQKEEFIEKSLMDSNIPV
jgi:hypothetical protein